MGELSGPYCGITTGRETEKIFRLYSSSILSPVSLLRKTQGQLSSRCSNSKVFSVCEVGKLSGPCCVHKQQWKRLKDSVAFVFPSSMSSHVPLLRRPGKIERQLSSRFSSTNVTSLSVKSGEVSGLFCGIKTGKQKERIYFSSILSPDPLLRKPKNTQCLLSSRGSSIQVASLSVKVREVSCPCCVNNNSEWNWNNLLSLPMSILCCIL